MPNPRPGRNKTTHVYVVRPRTDDEIPWIEAMEMSPLDVELTPELMDLWIDIAIAIWKLPKKKKKAKPDVA